MTGFRRIDLDSIEPPSGLGDYGPYVNFDRAQGKRRGILRGADWLEYAARAVEAHARGDSESASRWLAASAWVRAAGLLNEERGHWESRRGVPKGRGKGGRPRTIDDGAAHAVMLEHSRRTGEKRGETLAGIAYDSGAAKGNSRLAAVKRLASWWRRANRKK